MLTYILNVRRDVICDHSFSSSEVSNPNILDNSFSNEVSRLSQGRHGSDITGIHTLFFISKFKVL